ncbi:MAG: hypothetical protein QOD75_1141 [Blastocatellia bacterium]|jgi:hypothetical protein|nr:hypothetical protein [Blastocatellia bacterium]
MSTTFDPTGTFPTIPEFVRIRDRIIIDKKLTDKINAADPFIVTLIAREIEHEPGFNLKIPGGVIRIVASRYDAKRGSIDVSGAPGAVGAEGAHGRPGLAAHTINIPGGPGGPGAPGGPGDNAGSIHLLVERVGDVTLRANGGKGGKGGAGGTGGLGAKGEPPNPKKDGFNGSVGGDGGAAGNGGKGGKGGRIRVEFTAAGVPPPMLIEVAAGGAGDPGVRGAAGKSGRPAEGPEPKPGAAGHAGAPGVVGATVIEPIGAAKYYPRARAIVGKPTTAMWAAYRLLVGIYFYRRYKPNDQVREGQLKMASAEFDAILNLAPGNPEATRFQRQIELGQNVLGLSTTLDLLPDFDRYLNLYAALAGFVTDFFQGGIALLLKGDEKNAARERLALDIQQLRQQINVDMLDRDAAATGVEAAKKVYDHATNRLTQLNTQIAVAAAKKPDDSISIGAILTTVGTVAAAVGAVIAAVPTGGASLYALVPAIAGLTVQLSEIGGKLFDVTQAEKDALKAQYDEVGKNVDNVVEGVRATVNLVQAIEKLTAGTTPSNAEVVGLMRQGVELAYELLLARLQQEQAELTLSARTVAVASGKELVALAEEQLARIRQGEQIFIAAARSAVQATQRQADALLTVAFQAQRSVEIYTFQDASANVAFDSGFIHPDIEADFDEAAAVADAKELALLIPQLVSAYTESWQQFLDPIAMLKLYDNYFTSDQQVALVAGVEFLSITNASSLAAFKDRSGQQSRISFTIDLNDLPSRQFETKVEDVHVALVGASSKQPGLSCTVRHGGLYRLNRRDGGVIDQPLTPHIAHPTVQFNSLQVTGTPPLSGKAGRERIPIQNLWGRGVGGDWQISVEEEELKISGVDLSGLSEIQLWIETQTFVPIN